MMRRYRGPRPLRGRAFSALAAVLLGGCASAKYIQTGPSAAARADDCNIEVFASKAPDREYEELGILEGEGSWGADSLEDVLPKMKVEACRAGGDAIIMGSARKFVDSVDDTTLDVTATVIRWTGQPR